MEITVPLDYLNIGENQITVTFEEIIGVTGVLTIPSMC